MAQVNPDEVRRVGRRIEEYVRHCGGACEHAAVRDVLAEPQRVFSAAVRHLRESGRMTRTAPHFVVAS